MSRFPSLEWFETVRELVNNDEAFRRLGTIDARVGVKVGEQLLEGAFEAFECTGVRGRPRRAACGGPSRHRVRALTGPTLLATLMPRCPAK